MAKDLTALDTHFAFGKNWAEYAAQAGPEELAHARESLQRMFSGDTVEGTRFLDIGSGSGLFSAAALALGAREVVAVDIDPDSVATTRATLGRFAQADTWEARQVSVFDLQHEQMGVFDIVYSWGVLHHTGDLDRALADAAALVAPGGLFAVALYRKTLLCPVWRVAKRLYCAVPSPVQAIWRWLYSALFRLGLAVTGKRLEEYQASNLADRGMNFSTDVHDWLGGYPYQSIDAPGLAAILEQYGFSPVSVPVRRGGIGIFGSGCDEYVYRRDAA